MKTKLMIVMLFLFSIGIQPVVSNDLMGNLYGKWNVIKYQSRSEKKARSGTLVFDADGKFQSEGIHFGAVKGLFRTDENRSVLIIEQADGTTTEWYASVKNDVLRLRNITDDKRSRVHMTLKKA